MLVISVLLVFFTIFTILYSVFYMSNKDKFLVYERLEEIQNIDNNKVFVEEKNSFCERVLKPLYVFISKIFYKSTPQSKRNLLAKKLEKAGLLKDTTVERFLFNKWAMMLVFGCIIAMLTFIIEPNFFKSLLIAFTVVLLINTLFNFYISKRITDRKTSIIKDLPFTIDLITVSVEAGLSFDGAIARVINNIQGVLPEEFSKMLKEIRMGIERKKALKNLSERCDVKALSTIVTSLIQADELGVSLGKVLRIEAAQLRENRKQDARERAMKAPIKMLFPLIIFIFPAIFVIILGPAIISIFNNLVGGGAF